MELESRLITRYQRQAAVLMAAVALVWIGACAWLFVTSPPPSTTDIAQDVGFARWTSFGLTALVLALAALAANGVVHALLVNSVGHALVLVGLLLAVLLAGGTGYLSEVWNVGLVAVGTCFAAAVTVGSALAYRRLSMLALARETTAHAGEIVAMPGTRRLRAGGAISASAAAQMARAVRESGRQAAVADTAVLESDQRDQVRERLAAGVEKAWNPGEQTLIRVDNLHKHYGPIRAVDGVSFTIDRGEIVGFLGPNGAGKTTTMKVLTTYIPSTSGKASVAGFDTGSQPLQVRRRLGYLPESTPLYRDMTAGSYLHFIARARHVPIGKRDRNVAWVREACGLTPVWNMRINELSKGYKQRVGLAQAMVHEPDILILDEPTSGLDPNQIIEIRELIRELAVDRTVILSTHILQEVTALCSRVMVINQGRLAANGTAESLVQAMGPLNRVVARVRESKSKTQDRMNMLEEADRVEVTVESGSGKTTISRIDAVAGPGTDVDRLGRRIAQILGEEGIPLLELRQQQPSLEDVFVSLTAGART